MKKHKREHYFKNWKNITKISFGLLTVLAYSWILFHTTQLVGAEHKDFWWTAVVSYSLMLTLIVGVSDTRSKLFNVSVIKFIPRFLLFYIPALFIFSYILMWISPEGMGLVAALLTLPKWMLFVHLFVFATIESTLWQGYLDEKIGHPWSELSAGIFHWGVWTGSALVVIPTAAAVFGVFSFMNWYFRKDKDDLTPAIGTHAAYNHIKILIG